MPHAPFHNQIETIISTSTTSRETRTGVVTSVVEEHSESRADRVVSTNIAQSMRSRDITVTGEILDQQQNTLSFLMV
jgi:hypothetical protein